MAKTESGLQLRLHLCCQGRQREQVDGRRRRKGVTAKDEAAQARLIPRGGEVKGRSWVELAGTDDKEFPSGTELEESKDTDFE